MEDGETEAGTQTLVKELGASSGFLPASWAPVFRGMLLFKETPLNYFLLFVTFPSLSRQRFSPRGNKPTAAHTAWRGG